MRLGSTNRRASGELLSEMSRYFAGLTFDQTPLPDVTVHGLDMSRIKKAFSSVGRTVDKRKLETLDVLVRHTGKQVVSNGGLILFGRSEVRKNYFPDARVSCARFQGTDRTNFVDRLDIEGSVFDAIDEVPRFIRRNTRMAARIGTMRREDIPEYPEVAIREILVNAIAHADYSLTGMHIFVAIYSDKMEVQNPGMLPFGMTMDDFRSGVSKIRNRVIARVFRELGLMEEWGSGYRRVIESCRSGGYMIPDWQELGSAFRVIFYPHPEIKVAKVKAADVAARWNVTEKTAKRDISALKKHGIIEFVGPPKTGSYLIKET